MSRVATVAKWVMVCGIAVWLLYALLTLPSRVHNAAEWDEQQRIKKRNEYLDDWGKKLQRNETDYSEFRDPWLLRDDD